MTSLCRLLLALLMVWGVEIYGWGFVIQGLLMYSFLGVVIALTIVAALGTSTDGRAE